jgi:uncharacterized membrane protein
LSRPHVVVAARTTDPARPCRSSPAIVGRIAWRRRQGQPVTSKETDAPRMNKGRVESFSDGVLAVAITLLALNLSVKTTGGGSLAHQLGHQWPSFVAYALSFFEIGVIWVNHHALFALLKQVDRTLLFHNLVLLLWVTIIPFTTATLAGFVRGDLSDARLAVVLYSVSWEGMAISMTLILRHALRRNLLLRPVDRETGRRATRRFGVGIFVYPSVLVVGLFSPATMLVLYGLLTCFYIAEQTPILPPEREPKDPKKLDTD